MELRDVTATGDTARVTRLIDNISPYFIRIRNAKNKSITDLNVDWTYTDSDISDLKLVCFDYIRARYEGKEFRDIAKTGKEGSIFFFKDLWDDFLKQHQENTPADEETVDELRQRETELISRTAYPDNNCRS